MLLLGERYDAELCASSGWRGVWFPTRPHGYCAEVATRLAGLPPLAVGAMKRVLNRTASTDLVTALRLETDATVAGFLDPETTRLLKNF